MNSPKYEGVDQSGAWYSVLTPLIFLDRTKYFKDKTAVVYRDRRYSYEKFYENVMLQANAFLKRGLKREDKVSFVSRNRPEFLEAFFGVPFAAGVLVPINFRLSPKEMEYIINHSESRYVVVDEPFLSSLNEVRERIKAEIILLEDEENPTLKESDRKDVITYKELVRDGSPNKLPIPVEDEYSMITLYYTSGTTGLPKGVMHHHRGAFLNAMAEALEHQMSINSAYLWTLPMFHAAGWGFPWATVAVGATNVCLDKVDYPLIYQLIDREKVTHMCAAPTVYVNLVDHMKRNALKFKRKVHMVVAGAAPAPAVLRSVEEVGGEMSHVYGLTETYGPHSICEWRDEWNELPLEERARLKARQGIPYVGFEMDVFDPEGKPVPWDGKTIGEVVMRGHNVALGYYKNTEKTLESFRDGWFHSGDAAVVHPDGYIEIVDRFKDLINTGGEKVSSQLVEKTLMELDGVKAVAVYGTPDPKWGEVVTARIELKDGARLSAEEVIEFCKKRLAHFECPKIVEFGTIPMTATGKMQKYVLRREASKK
ncbi:AMP-binding protein [Metallosphaera tengchongensis]|uniref:AMP-binding protein n=1 Tax=Metallosphaera tengchongensis TaxID=1532350 RepID=A0A6N0NX79_9CREN|nr:acyl--CoA ligase family protein [Metallosphaera tengchongensis]QKR00219.1 AMP-binding protein [Metallosphaera tengchongensis]